MASIELHQVVKTYAGGHRGVRDLTLTIADGELMVFVGPSGSGKSTALRLVAGLESPDGGRISIGGVDVTDVPPQARDLAMVFQHYALYPHKTVRDNLGFALRVRGVPDQVRRERVQDVARALKIDGLLDRRPAQLSGGQRQRVALGRALVRQPNAFLLDEPLSNLDPALRLDTRAEISLLHRRLGATMLYVTHDQEEAMTLGDRVAVMDEGRVQQVGTPSDIYQRPANRFVAQFVGSPPMNILEGGQVHFPSKGGQVHFPQTGGSAPVPLPGSAPVPLLGIRPHDIEVVEPGTGDVLVEVEVVEPVGPSVHLRTRTAQDERLIVTVPGDRRADVGTRLGLRFRRERLHYFSKSTGERVPNPEA
jgi:multiple sugar transport system ATP-binding protein